MTMVELAAIIVACAALVTAFVAARKSSSDRGQANGNAVHSIIDAAQTAVGLTRETSATRIAELEKVVHEFRETIISLNSQIGQLRQGYEQVSITLHNALNAMDDLRVQVFNLQNENRKLNDTIKLLEADNKSLREHITQTSQT